MLILKGSILTKSFVAIDPETFEAIDLVATHAVIRASVRTKEGASGAAVITKVSTDSAQIEIMVDEAATRAARSASGATYNMVIDSTNKVLTLRIDNGATQTVTIPEATYAEISDLLLVMNDQIVGGYLDSNAGQIRLNSDTLGADSAVTILGGSAITVLGFTAGTSTGTGYDGDVTLGLFKVKFVAADTISLAPAIYRWDVWVTNDNGQFPVVPPSDFEVRPSVTSFV